MVDRFAGDGASAPLDVERFDILLQHYYHDDLDPSMADELNGLLATQIGLRRDFVELAQQQSALLRIFRENRALGAAIDTGPHPVQAAANAEQAGGAIADQSNRAAAGSTSPLLGFLGGLVRSSPGGEAIVGGLLLLAVWGALWGVVHFVQHAQNENESGSQQELLGQPNARVGSLTADRQSRWLRPDSQPLDGAARVGARHDLVSGQAQIKLASGVCLAIEGPATWHLASEQRVDFQLGRLVAQVPPAGAGFTVVTPSAQLVDLGTEFGVEVNERGTTDLHVIRGQVEVRPSADSAVTAQAGERFAAGQAVRLTRDHIAPRWIQFDVRRFEVIRGAASEGTAPAAHRFEQPIWLGNLFDDEKRTPLSEALRSDTFKATADTNDLGVHRCLSQGLAVVEIADAIQFDFTSLGWREDPRQVPVANDAWTPNGPEPCGLRLAQSLLTGNGKLEDGIGMHANAVLTFDLDELRAAGGWQDRKLSFVCDRSGVNDSALRSGYGSVHMVVIVSVAGGVETLMVDGTVGGFAKRQNIWLATAEPGEPLRPGDAPVRWDVPLSSDAKYLTLATTCAEDGIAFDHAVWIGARLEVINSPAERK